MGNPSAVCRTAFTRFAGACVSQSACAAPLRALARRERVGHKVITSLQSNSNSYSYSHSCSHIHSHSHSYNHNTRQKHHTTTALTPTLPVARRVNVSHVPFLRLG